MEEGITGAQLAQEIREAQAQLEPGTELITIVDRDQRPRLFRVIQSFGPQRGHAADTALVMLEHVHVVTRPERDWQAEAKAASPANV